MERTGCHAERCFLCALDEETECDTSGEDLVYLMAHSWGTYLGLQAVSQAPTCTTRTSTSLRFREYTPREKANLWRGKIYSRRSPLWNEMLGGQT